MSPVTAGKEGSRTYKTPRKNILISLSSYSHSRFHGNARFECVSSTFKLHRIRFQNLKICCGAYFPLMMIAIQAKYRCLTQLKGGMGYCQPSRHTLSFLKDLFSYFYSDVFDVIGEKGRGIGARDKMNIRKCVILFILSLRGAQCGKGRGLFDG